MYDVAIIGGGLSGLAAAVGLALKGAKVALFEQAPRLGGRCYSYVDEKTGDIVDNGQHVLLGAYHNLLRYLELIGTRRFLKSEPALVLPFHHPTKGRVEFRISSLPKPFHLTTGMLKFNVLSFRDRQRLLRVGLALRGWSTRKERELANLTVDQWLKKLGQSDDALRSLWYPIAISAMNEAPERTCALLFARVLHQTFFGTKQGSAVLIPTVGQAELYVREAEKYLSEHKARISTNTEVVSLCTSNSRIAGVELNSGEIIPSRYVISTVPPYALTKLIPSEFIKESPFSHLGRFDFSPIISLHLWFDRQFMDVEYVGLIGKHLQWVFDRRKIMSERERQTGYISAVISGARDLIHLSKEKLLMFAIRDLHEVFPVSRKAKLDQSVIIKEKRATFSPTCEIEPLRPSPVTPIENFYLAGDWTNTCLPATIEGAVLSGFRAAKLIS